MNLGLQSIAGKTLLIFIGVFVLVLLPVNTLIYLRIKSALEESETRELKTEAERLMDQVRLDPIAIPLPRQGFSTKVQFRSITRNEKLFESPDFPGVDDAYFSVDAFQLDTLIIVNYRRPAGEGELVLSLARNNAVVRGRLGEIKNYLLLANGMSMVIACALVFLITAFTTRPIQRIIAVANRINASRSMERVPVPHTNDETRALAETLNLMLSRLENSIKQQTNFFASAAHELKTPLSVMKNELALALTNQETNSTELLESCLKEVDRLNRIIHDFLLISQLKSQSLSIGLQSVAIDEILYSALKKVRFLAKDKNANIRVQIDEQSNGFNAMADSDLLETVLINVLDNAILHGTSTATVDVALTKTAEKVFLSITNPIDEIIEDPEALKGEFNKIKSFSPGFGMGLWICDQVLKLHGGEFELEMAPSKVFVVRLGVNTNRTVS